MGGRAVGGALPYFDNLTKKPMNGDDTEVSCPYGVPGDRLWVKESWCAGRGYDADPATGVPSLAPKDIPAGVRIYYLADGPKTWKPDWAGRARSPLHMPRTHAWIVFELTEARIERVQDLSEENAIAEGVAPAPGQPAIEAFAGLWAGIHGAKSWEANPWVWAISFRRV